MKNDDRVLQNVGECRGMLCGVCVVAICAKYAPAKA